MILKNDFKIFQDELVAVSEKSVLRVPDLLDWQAIMSSESDFTMELKSRSQNFIFKMKFKIVDNYVLKATTS